MKLLVEFDDKAEMDEWFAASKAGAIAPASSVYLVNKTGQSFGLKMTTATDDPEAAVIEIYQRGTEDAATLVPDAAMKIV